MAILVTSETRLVVQGITGREGSFHAIRNRDYGTKVVAGVTPGKRGQDVQGVPVYDTVSEAVELEGANTAMVFVPPRFAADAIYEAASTGVHTIICISEGIPAHEMLDVYSFVRARGVRLLGPNCPGALSPGIANVGIIPPHVFKRGPVGLVSRSGTLTYQIGNELAQAGVGNSTIVGIGGDPIVGSSFIDILEQFEADPDTELIVMVGEIGGDEEEKAARYIDEHMTKPVVAYIAGFEAPAGKTMGHAGAIISGTSGTAQGKKEALEARGIAVGTNPTEAATLAADRVRATGVDILWPWAASRPDVAWPRSLRRQPLAFAPSAFAAPRVEVVVASASRRSSPTPRGSARCRATGTRSACSRARSAPGSTSPACAPSRP